MKPSLRLEYRRIGELEENPLNWRRHPERQLQGLREILTSVGWAGAVLYNEQTGRLIDGHARKEVSDPDEEVPVLVGSWTADEERQILATLDPLGALARADLSRLKGLLAQTEVQGESLGKLLEDLKTGQVVFAAPGEQAVEPFEQDPAPDPPDEVRILVGDVREKLKELEAESVHCVVTSPPYWGLRDYGVEGQVGLEETLDEWVATQVDVFQGVWRVLRDDGTCWLNLGDCYAMGGKHENKIAGMNAGGTKPVRPPVKWLKPKDLVGQPWRLAFALQADGWYLRSAIIWHKPNPMPESVTDRPTSSHEYVFLLTKSERYFYDADAVREETEKERNSAKGFTGSGKRGSAKGSDAAQQAQFNGPEDHPDMAQSGHNLRDVWTIPTQPCPEAHFATFPKRLVEPCVKAGCPLGGTVLDPYGGSGTTAEVALSLGRNAILIELNPEYVEIAKRRLAKHAT